MSLIATIERLFVAQGASAYEGVRRESVSLALLEELRQPGRALPATAG